MVTKHDDDAVQTRAADTLVDRCLLQLTPEDFDAFVQALDSPPEAGPKLKALLTRTPPWKR
jgi:uncharacterized protein (DUF1778 family)